VAEEATATTTLTIAVDRGRQQQERSSSTPKHPRFEGRCNELKGHIYDYFDKRQTDGYTKTTGEIAEYIGRAYRHGADIRAALGHIDMPMTWSQPADPAIEATQTETKLWELQCVEFSKRLSKYEENLGSAYSLIWGGQCTDALGENSALMLLGRRSRPRPGMTPYPTTTRPSD
jgi:hypothetical protein